MRGKKTTKKTEW